jgi:hypothetical protein
VHTAITQLPARDDFESGTFVNSGRKDWQNIIIATVHTVGTCKAPCKNIGFSPVIWGFFPLLHVRFR